MVSEVNFQHAVVDAAALHGWRICHTRKAIVRNGRVATPTSVLGWPDLVLWNPARGGVMFVELKTERGVLSTDQQDVLGSLERAGAVVDVWRPSEWSRITELLQGKRAIDLRALVLKLATASNPDFSRLSQREVDWIQAEVDHIREGQWGTKHERTVDAANRGIQ